MLEQAMESFAGRTLIRDRYDNYISGQWVPPANGAYFDNISPVTGQVVCQVARGTAADIELALDAAHAAKDAWGKTSSTERANILNKIAQRMEDNLVVQSTSISDLSMERCPLFSMACSTRSRAASGVGPDSAWLLFFHAVFVFSLLA